MIPMPAPLIATKLFLDGGDPAESRRARDVLGRLDGQTTNPSLIAQNPEFKRRVEAGKKLTRAEAMEMYRQVVLEIAAITKGPLSIEVDADEASTADDLINQGRRFFPWTPNAYIKYPTTSAGLEAAQRSVAEGI